MLVCFWRFAAPSCYAEAWCKIPILALQPITSASRISWQSWISDSNGTCSRASSPHSLNGISKKKHQTLRNERTTVGTWRRRQRQQQQQQHDHEVTWTASRPRSDCICADCWTHLTGRLYKTRCMRFVVLAMVTTLHVDVCCTPSALQLPKRLIPWQGTAEVVLQLYSSITHESNGKLAQTDSMEVIACADSYKYLWQSEGTVCMPTVHAWNDTNRGGGWNIILELGKSGQIAGYLKDRWSRVVYADSQTSEVVANKDNQRHTFNRRIKQT